MRAVSMFSNCGAGDVGYQRAGFDFRVMAELSKDRLGVALKNHGDAEGVQGDLRETWPRVVEAWIGRTDGSSPDLLAACPPCQGMSTARGGLGRHDDPLGGGRDARNLLVTVIEAVAKELQPRAIVVENVPAFLTRAVPHPRTGAPISAALFLTDALADQYQMFPMVADLADWGVPQTRKRAFLTFINRAEVGLMDRPHETPFPQPTHAVDWGAKQVSITESLRELRAAPLDAQNENRSRDPDNAMHFVPVWDERRYKMVAAIPSGSGRSAWQNSSCASCSESTIDSEAASCPHCNSPLLRPVVLDETGWRLIKGFRTSSYTRMRSDVPASTITTASGRLGSDKTIHPHENRLLSPYECAHLQTLPSDFDWDGALERLGHTSVREMIGEAVPPRFTELHGLAIRNFLEGSSGGGLLPLSDQRVTTAQKRLLATRTREVGA